MQAFPGFEFEIVRIAVAFAMLATASFFDLRKRSVSDLLWLVFAAAAGILYVFDFPPTYAEGVATLASMGLTAAVSYGVYRAGLFGGADMLALITFSAIMPLYNLEILSGLFGGIVSATALHPFAPLIVLSNAVIFSLAQVLANLVRNLYRKDRLFEGFQHEPTARKLLAMIIGHRSDNPRHAFSIERTVGGRREFDFALKPAESAEFETRKDMWVMSATPFLVFMAAGFVMMIFGGDLLAILLNLAL